MNDSLKILLAVLVALFGFLTIFYGIKYNQAKKTTTTYLIEKEEVNKEYNNLVNEFEILSAELDSVIIAKKEAFDQLDIQNLKLENLKAEISNLLEKDILTRTELDKARQLIDELKAEKDILLAKISTLNSKNKTLKKENDQITRTITVVTQQKDSVIRKMGVLEEVNKDLKEDKKELIEVQEQNAEKVAFSQVIPVKLIEVVGVKYKNNGREKETSNYRRVDKLAINFQLGENPVAEVGPKEFLIRVINPDGTIAYNRSRGSGNFVSSNDEGMKFTTRTAVDFQHDQKQVSVFWRQDIPFQKGTYSVEIYHAGYLVGTNNFELRGGL